MPQRRHHAGIQVALVYEGPAHPWWVPGPATGGRGDRLWAGERRERLVYKRRLDPWVVPPERHGRLAYGQTTAW